MQLPRVAAQWIVEEQCVLCMGSVTFKKMSVKTERFVKDKGSGD